MPSVFIAYHSVDKSTVIDPLRNHLQNAHQLDSVWYDEALYGGVTFWQDTRRQIQRADVMIYVNGAEANERPTLDEALAQHRPVLVLRTPPAPLLSVAAETVSLSAGALNDTDRANIDRALERLGIIKSEDVLNRASDFATGFDDLNFAPLTFETAADVANGAGSADDPQDLSSQPLRERWLPGVLAVLVTVAAVFIGINFALTDANPQPQQQNFPTLAPLDRQGTTTALEATAGALVQDNSLAVPAAPTAVPESPTVDHFGNPLGASGPAAADAEGDTLFRFGG